MFGITAFAQAPFAALGSKVSTASLEAFASTADAVAVQVNFVATDAEGATATASVNTINNVFNNYFVDSVTGSAAPTATSVLRPSQAEAATASSAVSVLARFVATQNSAVTAAAAVSKNAVLGAARVESATASAQVNRFVVYTVALSESASVQDLRAASVSFAASILEQTTAVGDFVGVLQVNVYPTGIELVVTINNVLVWAVIPTPDNPNWANIATTSTSWTEVSTASSPNWVDVTTTSTTWTEIPIPPVGGWNDIPT